MFSIDVSPDMNMYTLLISQAYEPSFALCEFIDNAIHAHLKSASKDPLTVNIDFFSSSYKDSSLKNRIIITDNGAGINRQLLETALKPASKPKSKGLSEFGIGMKAASVWFTDEWELHTWPAGEGKEYSCIFSLPTLLSNGSSSLTVFDSENKNEKRGTKITLKNIRRDITEERYAEIVNNIENIYQRFISGDAPRVIIKSSYNESERILKFSPFESKTLHAPKHSKQGSTTYTTGEAKDWRVNVDIIFQGHPVKGFIEIKEVGSYPKNPGLVLFRYDRVICGLPSKKYIPLKIFKTSNKHRAMRVYGELVLDGMPVSYTKDRFNFDDDDFCQALLNNVQHLNDLLTQADNYRTRNVTHGSVGNLGNTTNNDTSPPTSNTGESPELNNSAEDMGTGSGQNGNENSGDSGGNNHSGSRGGTKNEDSGFSSALFSQKNETKIKASPSIIARLEELGSKKFLQLYRSLCIISLEQHPAIMYIGAWAFFESLAKKSGSSTDFPAYFGSKMNHFGYDRELKKSIGKCISDISEEGNCVKHDSAYVSTDAKKLAHYFEVTEKLILDVLDEIIKSTH